jgi:hypothetical protein
MTTYIRVKFSFEGQHRWPEAPDEVAFLRNRHRHVFEGHAHIQVNHDDRELEYFMVQRRIHALVLDWPDDLGRASCEEMAKDVLGYLAGLYGSDRNYKVEILEDGENGSVVKYRAGQ